MPARQLLQRPPSLDGRPDDVVLAIILLALVAATLTLVARIILQHGPCAQVARAPTRAWLGWDAKFRTSSIANDVPVELHVDFDEGDSAEKGGLPATFGMATHEGGLPDGKEQPLSGWIRSMRPPQGYALLGGAGHGGPARVTHTQYAGGILHGLSCISLEIVTPCGDEQCVTPNKLSPHPDLPRIRVTLPSPTLRQKHLLLS